MKDENVWNRNRGCADLLLLSFLFPVLIPVFFFVFKFVLELFFPDWLSPHS